MEVERRSSRWRIGVTLPPSSSVFAPSTESHLSKTTRNKPRSEHFSTLAEATDRAYEVLRESEGAGGYVVYALECDNGRTETEFRADASDIFGSESAIPAWAWTAHHADGCFYVRYTSNFAHLFAEHCLNVSSRGALFTGLFPPRDVARLAQFQTATSGMNAEATLAKILEDELREAGFDDPFVYQQ